MYSKRCLKSSHACEMTKEVDELPIIMPGTGIVRRFRRWFRRQCLVNPTHPRCRPVIYSQSAIAMEKSRHLNQFYWMVHPFSNMRMIWEMFMCLLLALSLVVIPYHAAYSTTPETMLGTSSNIWFVLYLILCVGCFLDLCGNFYTGVFDPKTQEIHLSQKVVVGRYLRGYFLVDLISTLPFDTIVAVIGREAISNETYHIIALFGLLKILRLKSLYDYFNSSLQVYNFRKIPIKIIRTTFFSLLYIHWMACISYIVPHIRQVSDPNSNLTSWISVAGISNATASIKYIHSLYRSISITTLMGYGHGAPTTTEDTALTVIIATCGYALFIYIVATALQILYVTNNSSFKNEEETAQLNDFLRHKKLPRVFRKRLLSLNEFKFQESFFREKDILSVLSGQLRQEIVVHSCRHLVENVGFFNNLSPTMLVRLVTCLRSEIYLNNQEVVKFGTHGDSMYFIASGSVAVYTSTGNEICHLRDGNHFGEIALLSSDHLRVASVVTLEISELYRLDASDFNRIIGPYPDLLVAMQNVASQRLEHLQRLDRLLKTANTIEKSEFDFKLHT